MATFIALVFVAACVAAVIWNKKNAAAAMDGVTFNVRADAAGVAEAVRACYCAGVGSKARAAIGGIAVTPVTSSSFRVETRLGDVGEIVVKSTAAGSTIVARTTELYVGSHPASHFRGPGLWHTSARLGHGVYKMLGITPGAARMKHFQSRIESRVERKLARV